MLIALVEGALFFQRSYAKEPHSKHIPNPVMHTINLYANKKNNKRKNDWTFH